MKARYFVAALCLSLLTTSSALIEGSGNPSVQNRAPARRAEGRIRGVVKDNDGTGIRSATVEVRLKGCRCEQCKNPKLCDCCPPQRLSTTNRSGAFEVLIAPGIYNITFRASGFREHTVNDVTVTSGETRTLDVTLGIR